MPLPAALLAKLAKRGILGDTQKVQEEVFVENHDPDEEVNPENYEYHSRKRDNNQWMQKVKRRFKETTKGVKGCPNKWNIFHICSVFCLERWGDGTEKPSKEYRKRFQRLLERYPLPKKGNWVYIWDAGCEAYYFWNKDDDLVSWLPPKHPKALIGKSASTIRSEKDMPDLGPDTHDDVDMSLMPPPARSPPPSQEYHHKASVPKKNKSRDLEKILRTKKGRRQFYENSATVDPMDPAAYSDIPKGRWSAGLEAEDRAADSTANGTLFQQRPLPSPGDILRAQGKRKDSNDDSDEGADLGKRRRFSDEME